MDGWHVKEYGDPESIPTVLESQRPTLLNVHVSELTGELRVGVGVAVTVAVVQPRFVKTILNTRNVGG